MGYSIQIHDGTDHRAEGSRAIERIIPLPLERPVSLDAVVFQVGEPYRSSLLKGSSRFLKLDLEDLDSLGLTGGRLVQANLDVEDCSGADRERARELLEVRAREQAWPASWRKWIADPPAAGAFEAGGLTGHRELLGDEDVRFAQLYLVWWLESAFPAEVGDLKRNVTAMSRPGEEGIPREYRLQYIAPGSTERLEARLSLGASGEDAVEELIAEARMKPAAMSDLLFEYRGRLMAAMLLPRVHEPPPPELHVRAIRVVLGPDALLLLSHELPYGLPLEGRAFPALELAARIDFERLAGFVDGDLDSIPPELTGRIEKQKATTREIMLRHRGKPATRE